MIIEKDRGGVVSQISFPIQNILKIQENAIKDPLLRVLPKYNAQGNKHQWILPTGANERWIPLGAAQPEIRQQVLNKISEAKQAFSSLQKGADARQVDTIFNSPSNDEFIYYRTDFDGTLMGIAIAGWGFRYPDNSQQTGAVMANMSSSSQNVKVSMMDEGIPASNREFKYGLPSSAKSKVGITDTNGECAIGQFMIGIEFFVFDRQTAKNFTFKVAKGQEMYICDVTAEKPVIPVPPIQEPEPPVAPEPPVPPVPPVPKPPVVNPPEIPEIPEVPEVPKIHKPDDDPKWSRREVTPVLLVKDETGKPVPNFPVYITKSETRERVFSDPEGYIQMQTMLEEDTFYVTDGFTDSNRQDYTVAVDTEEYVYNLDYTVTQGNRDISIHIIDEKGRPVCKDYVVLKSNERIFQCTPDEKGIIYLDNSDLERNKPLEFILVKDGKEISTKDFMLIPDEQEYTVQIDTQVCPWWKRLVEILAILLSAAAILWLFGFIVAICDSIS